MVEKHKNRNLLAVEIGFDNLNRDFLDMDMDMLGSHVFKQPMDRFSFAQRSIALLWMGPGNVCFFV